MHVKVAPLSHAIYIELKPLDDPIVGVGYALSRSDGYDLEYFTTCAPGRDSNTCMEALFRWCTVDLVQ